MKKLLVSALAGALVLTACSAKPVNDTKTMVVEGRAVDVQIRNIASFEVEIAPNKAVCALYDNLGNAIDSECLQYRRTFDRNYNVIPGDIEGFEFERGYRYVLDIKQTAALDEQTGQVVPVWSLNKIVSKTAERL